MTKLIFPIGILAAGALIGIFNLMPAWNRFQELRGEIAHLESIAAELDDLLITRDLLASKIQDIPRADLERSEQMIPKRPNGPEFLISVEQMALANAIDIERLDIGTIVQKSDAASAAAGSTGIASETPDTIKNLPVQIGARGPYEPFKSFLRNLEEFVRLTDVGALTFTGGGSGQTSDLFNVSISAKTYYQ